MVVCHIRPIVIFFDLFLVTCCTLPITPIFTTTACQLQTQIIGQTIIYLSTYILLLHTLIYIYIYIFVFCVCAFDKNFATTGPRKKDPQSPFAPSPKLNIKSPNPFCLAPLHEIPEIHLPIGRMQCMCIYIYIHKYIYIHIYIHNIRIIYIYVYILRPSEISPMVPKC